MSHIDFNILFSKMKLYHLELRNKINQVLYLHFESHEELSAIFLLLWFFIETWFHLAEVGFPAVCLSKTNLPLFVDTMIAECILCVDWQTWHNECLLLTSATVRLHVYIQSCIKTIIFLFWFLAALHTVSFWQDSVCKNWRIWEENLN